MEGPREENQQSLAPLARRAESLACRRCRARKVKCDGQYPTCGRCQKVNCPCIVADDSASRRYTRPELRELVDKARQLEALLGETEPSSKVTGDDSPGPDPAREHIPGSPRANNRYLGSASGARFLSYMLKAIRQHAASPDFESLLSRRTSGPPVYYHEPHPLPANEQICQALEEYFNVFHIQHPFLDPATIWATVAHLLLYRNLSPTSMTHDQRLRLFQLNMVMSIGSVGLFQQGQYPLHPFGFFTAAIQAIAPSGFCFNRLEDIENFLLIARFGVYFYIGCSIWEISSLCMRICIELNLHRQSPTPVGTHERPSTIFWECYLLDRFGSGMLGRPFAIDDQDIETSLPASTSVVNSHRVFAHMVELARLTSEIRRAFNSQSQEYPFVQTVVDRHLHLSRRASTIHATLAAMHDKLVQWRSTAPASDTPACVYLTPEYFELRFQEERLALLRAAIEAFRPGSPHTASATSASAGREHLPQSSDPFPSLVLQRTCMEAACGLISAYDVLQRRGLIVYSRYYMQLLFSAGLLVILGVFVRVDNKTVARTRQQLTGSGGGDRNSDTHSVVDVSAWLSPSFTDDDSGPDELSLDRALEALGVVGGHLSWLAEQMPDSALYSRVFNALRENTSRIVRRYQHQHQNDQSRENRVYPPYAQSQSQTLAHHGYVGLGMDDMDSASATAHLPLGTTNQLVGDGEFGIDYCPSMGTSSETNLTGILEELFPNMPVDMLDDDAYVGLGTWPLSQMPIMPGFTGVS